jgi:putative isomerase
VVAVYASQQNAGSANAGGTDVTMRSTNIALGRAWNTWSSVPAEMVFLPLGVRLTPVVYSDRLRRASRLPSGARFGRHTVDGRHVEIELDHGGTVLALQYTKPGPFEVLGEWETRRLGEWGLRFWVNLCLSTEAGDSVSYDVDAGAAIARIGARLIALFAPDPVQVTGHQTIEELIHEYDTRGYFYRASRATHAKVLVLRFNLEMTRQGRFALAVADRADLAVRTAKELFARPPEARALSLQTGRFAGALEAVEDVIGWNTVYDEINQRPYTSISRNWNQDKFGGFGVWLTDQQYAAHMSALFDTEIGRENLLVALASATPDGNLACLLTAEDAWVDRSQLPLGAFLAWLLYQRSGSRPFLTQSFDALVRNHHWWWRCRDPEQQGLASFGSSDVGDGLYKGTSFAARNESSMDNAPFHDECVFDPRTRVLSGADVGLNSLLALDAEFLAQIASELGHARQSAEFGRSAADIRARISDRLWDESRHIFANRLRSGKFVSSLGPTSFYPLICGAVTDEQAKRLLDHLSDASTFGGTFVVPTTSRADPAFADNCYWRGRIWPPVNYLVWHGLKRYGLEAAARSLAEASFDMFFKLWRTGRLCPENYNATTGEALDQPDTDRFYSWGALMPLLGVSQVMDVNPWGGWEITNDGTDARLGPIESPIGSIILHLEAGQLQLWKGELLLMRSNIIGRLSHIGWGEGRIVIDLPGELEADAWLRFPTLRMERVCQSRYADRTIEPQRGDHGELLIQHLPKQPQRATLTLVYDRERR